MSVTQPSSGAKAGASGMRQASSWSRDIRFVSGMVLLVFATTHFLNHAIGIFGLAAMETVQNWRYAVWHSMPGTVLLYGALIVHPLFALLRVAQRRTLRMPAREILQIALGLTIPLLLVDHVVSTRILGQYFGISEEYSHVLRRMWPGGALWQSMLLLLVWIHGMIGVHLILRSRESYRHWRDPFLLVAILLPLLALIGFSVAGRETMAMETLPHRTAAEIAMFEHDVFWAKALFFSLVGVFALSVAIREVRVRTAHNITVRFVGHGVRKISPGLTVLEMFRRFGIPHAALCGGRARCATCRVLVLDGAGDLPRPAQNEARLLKRIAAPAGVRLACQIRPTQDIQVQLLLASHLSRGAGRELDSRDMSRRGLTVMVADLRAFTALSERQLPHELLGLISRFFDEMSQAITAHGGRIDAFYGDGFMAVFGIEGTPARAARAAITAAADIVRAVEALNREFGRALPVPLRIGIGVHAGEAVTGAVESESYGRRELTVGETVAVANQLEAATRRVLSDVIVSEDTIKLTGKRYRDMTTLKVMIKGRDKPMGAFGFASAPEVADADADKDEPEQAPPASDAAVTLAADDTGEGRAEPEPASVPPAEAPEKRRRRHKEGAGDPPDQAGP